MGFALYTFGGLEFVAITTGESRSAQEIPRAIKLTFTVLASVYLGAIIILVGVMPWNRAGVTESPFVTVFRHAHVPARITHHDLRDPYGGALRSQRGALCGFAHPVFPGTNGMGAGGFWTAQRFRIAKTGAAGFVLRHRGRAGAGEVGAEERVRLDSWRGAGGNAAVLAGLSGRARQIPQTDFAKPAGRLPMRSPLGAWGSALGFLLIIVALLETGWDSRLTLISGAVYMVVLTAAYFLLKKNHLHRHCM